MEIIATQDKINKIKNRIREINNKTYYDIYLYYYKNSVFYSSYQYFIIKHNNNFIFIDSSSLYGILKMKRKAHKLTDKMIKEEMDRLDIVKPIYTRMKNGAYIYYLPSLVEWFNNTFVPLEEDMKVPLYRTILKIHYPSDHDQVHSDNSIIKGYAVNPAILSLAINQNSEKVMLIRTINELNL